MSCSGPCEINSIASKHEQPRRFVIRQVANGYVVEVCGHYEVAGSNEYVFERIVDAQEFIKRRMTAVA